MFFSNTRWTQLTAPFYSTLFETSISPFNSCKCSPIIPDEVREHLTRDQRPFLHPESLQILRFTASPLQFTHSSSTGFRSENTWHEIRDHSFIQNHSRSSDSQLLLFSSLTHLLQGSGQRTPDTRSETIPSSRITPDLQIHSFSSSVHSLIFYRVQVRGLGRLKQKLGFVLSDPFLCYFLGLCLDYCTVGRSKHGPL